MAFGGGVFFLACSLLLNPIGATNEALAPTLSPIWNETCDGIYCGKGTCNSYPNGTFTFSCECDLGWTQYQINDYYNVSFMPCVIPNCTLNYSCLDAAAPAAAAPPLAPTHHSIFNHSIFDPCSWAYCGQGTCMRTANFTYTCECEEGYSNLLNITAFPCFSECALGQDCGKMDATSSNASSSTPTSASDNGRSSNNACKGFPKNLFQLIISGISLAMLPWI